jgi:hypothetical protein
MATSSRYGKTRVARETAPESKTVKKATDSAISAAKKQIAALKRSIA